VFSSAKIYKYAIFWPELKKPKVFFGAKYLKSRFLAQQYENHTEFGAKLISYSNARVKK